MKIEDLDDFKKDVRGLLKSYRSLNEDLDVVRKVLVVMPDERPPVSFKMMHSRIDAEIINMGITCKTLKGVGISSGLRLIYAWIREEDRIVMMGIFHRDYGPTREKRILKRKF